jgi:hypothetical protein
VTEYGPKTLACLLIAHMGPGHPKYLEAFRIAADAWSEKAVIAKMEQLARKGIVDYGVSPAYSWLTPKGHDVLEEAFPK